MNTDPTPHREQRASLEVVVLLTAAALLAVYAAVRYAGLWGENDTSAFAKAIWGMVDEGRLAPQVYAYPNGYGFPALGTFLVRVTGLSVAQLQLFGSALLAVWVVLPAWLAYRALIGSARGATLATVIILTQPEFLFPILRGSHEKFTRGLIFLCLYLLVSSIISRRRWRRLASFILVFYLTVYALITFNNLFATSFIAALALALALSLLVRRLGSVQTDENSAARRRLLYALLISLILAFFFTFYAYTPARHDVLIFESIWDRLALLFLDVERVAVSPYETVGRAWVSVPVYFIVSIANWLLLAASFVLWLAQTLAWWRKRAWPTEPQVILLWSFYIAFGFMGTVSILVDFSGALGSNLQHRIFPTFAMIAAAVVADWFVRRPQQLPGARRRLAYGALVIGIVFLGIVAVAKATNEPAVSNKWSYYTRVEFTALEWSRANNPDNLTWAGFDERLRTAIAICCNWEADGARFDDYVPDASTRNYLISDVIRARGRRLEAPLPIEGDSLLVYDNGAAEIYRLRPRTPFQK